MMSKSYIGITYSNLRNINSVSFFYVNYVATCLVSSRVQYFKCQLYMFYFHTVREKNKILYWNTEMIIPYG